MSAYRMGIQLLLLLVGVGWCAACSAPNTLQVEAPFARNSKTIGLSVDRNVYHDDTNTVSYELWRVDLEKSPFEVQRILTSTTALALVDCRPFDVQCVALASDVGEVSQLLRWQVTPAHWEEITPTQSILGFPGNILALSSQGVWLNSCGGAMNTCSLSLQAYDQSSIITATNYSYIRCDRPQLSPAGGYWALHCWNASWGNPDLNLAPAGQFFRLIKTDNTGEYSLTLPTTYFFYENYLCCHQGILPRPPDFAWSPDGTELAFVAAFSPPILLADTPQPQTSPSYKSFGGIYSISLKDKTISEWAKVGGSNVPLAWSPDGEEIAYAKQGIVYVASRDGSQRQLGSLDVIKSLLWSPDGNYIAVQGIGGVRLMQLWIISMSDSVWHKVDFPGQVMDIQQVMDMRWATLNAP